MTTNTEPVNALNLDFNQQLSFIRFFNKLPEKSASTVRFFNHSDYYSLHGEDAILTSTQLFNTNVLKYMGEEPKLSYICLNKINFEKYVRELLLVMQYRVEVYVKPSQSKNQDWVLEYKGSPGNLQQFEDILFDSGTEIIGGCVMGIKLAKNNVLGVACVNTVEGTFNVTEFPDNEFFTELEALVAQVTPKECIISIGETPDLIRLKNMLERSGILVVKSKKSDFDSTDIAQDLNRLLFFSECQQRNAMGFRETNQVVSTGSLQAVIKYLNLIGDEQNFNQYKLGGLDVHRYVRLDYAAINALNLVNKPGVTLNKYDTVYGVLNSCSTPQGKRLLEKWLKQPLRDINLLTERLDVVETFVNDSEARNILSSFSLNKIPDLLILSKRLCTKKASLQDCYRVYQTIDSVPALVAVLRKCGNKSVKAMLIDPISETLTDLNKFQSMIEQTIDLDLVDRGEYLIKPDFNKELNELSKQKNKIEEKMQKVFRYAASDLGFEVGKTIKMECTDQHGYFFRVTLKEEPVLRKNKTYKIIDAVKGGVRFNNDKLQDLNEAYTDIKQSYEKQQKSIVRDILDVAAGYTDSLRNLNVQVAIVDVLVAFANTAANAPIPYVRPKILASGSGILKLTKARHPCLEKQDGVNIIPNDVEFRKDEKLLHIITGPNMGGKSTFMRTVGVNVVMAHIGSFVACDEAEISLVDCVLARVGSDDSELKGLSTFMMEMVETNGIVRSATSNSLVIIDELGRGTSTYDGCGIAWAVAEFLAKEIKCFSLFATHYHEITHLEEQIPTVSNLHVTAIVTEKTITPLYQMRQGVCDKSYGIHCARLAEFPEDVIQFASEYQEKLEDREGMKYVKDLEFSLKRKEVEDGDKLLADALQECRDWDVANMTDDELMDKINKIKADLQSRNNLFVNGIIGKKLFLGN